MRKPLTVRLIHWLVVLLFVLAVPTGYRLSDTSWPGTGAFNREIIHVSHQTAGILVALCFFIWALLRLIYRFRAKTTSLTLYDKLVALSHLLLGSFGATISCTGWMGSSAGNYGQTLFGIIEVPNLIPVLSAKEAVWMYGLHKALVPYFIVFLGLHLLAVLFHTFVLRDSTVRGMGFSKQEKSRPQK